MNAKVAVLNVNPAASAAGTFSADGALSALRRRVYRESSEIAKQKSGRALRLAFGNTSMSETASRRVMVMRMLYAIVMILGGFMIGSELGYKYCAPSIFAVVAGFMLLPGIFTRATMTISALWMGYTALGSLMMGDVAVVELILAAGSAVMAYTGPGRYSVDANLRRQIFRIVKRRETRRIMEERFSYKAMLYNL